jgi:hypothetical protein
VRSSSSGRRKPRHPAAAAAAVALAVLTAATTGACRVDVRVGIDSDPDGGGTVRAEASLDPDAVEELVGRAAGDPDEVDPATRIKVDDLREAGWTIQGPTPTDGGGLAVVATHDFADEAEARRLVDEIGGAPDGPFADVALTQERGFFKTRTTFAATVDLERGLGAFTDQELREALEATPDAPLGITQQQLEQRLGEAIDRMFGLQVAVRLPGDLTTTNAPGANAVWQPKLGERIELEAEAERWNVRNLVALAVAAASALALATVLLTRRRTHAPATTDTTEPEQAEA